jgi:hypothetical protein
MFVRDGLSAVRVRPRGSPEAGLHAQWLAAPYRRKPQRIRANAAIPVGAEE